jgi:hydroxyacylglutathione hydrolase
MKRLFAAVFTFASTLLPTFAWADPTPAAMDMHWDAGAETCPAKVAAPLQIYAYDAHTYILRESLCATWEAPFMYLLVGSKQALLIDTGDVADPKFMPLAATVMGLLPGDAQTKLPLLVVHSHGHLDHREGDAQFQQLPKVQVVASDLDHVRQYFGFQDWPNGMTQVDLGDRIVDVLPAPGHHRAHLVYYDRNTGILFSGDFLLPGRLLVDDLGAYQASARRVADFVKDRPVSYVLGGHIEKNRAGELFDWESTYHPDERPLPLSKTDVLALPAALQAFNGFYSDNGGFVIMNPIRNLLVMGIAAVLVLGALVFLLYRFIRRRRRKSA